VVDDLLTRRVEHGHITRTVLTCMPGCFEVHGHPDAYEGEHRTFARDWHRTIPRDCL
jgi:hypothetical protein